ncbi:MAG: response regulator [Terracidiphilus sp.]
MKSQRKNAVIIAIVDDDESVREALAGVLKTAGFAVRIYASAEEFLESYDGQEIACLLLDIRLPGMSGVELQRKMIESGNRVPIVFITAHGDENLRNVLMNAGASGFLEKPVRRETLLAQIGAAISKTAEG